MARPVGVYSCPFLCTSRSPASYPRRKCLHPSEGPREGQGAQPHSVNDPLFLKSSHHRHRHHKPQWAHGGLRHLSRRAVTPLRTGSKPCLPLGGELGLRDTGHPELWGPPGLRAPQALLPSFASVPTHQCSTSGWGELIPPRPRSQRRRVSLVHHELNSRATG